MQFWSWVRDRAVEEYGATVEVERHILREYGLGMRIGRWAKSGTVPPGYPHLSILEKVLGVSFEELVGVLGAEIPRGYVRPELLCLRCRLGVVCSGCGQHWEVVEVARRGYDVCPLCCGELECPSDCDGAAGEPEWLTEWCEKLLYGGGS